MNICEQVNLIYQPNSVNAFAYLKGTLADRFRKSAKAQLLLS